MTKQIVNQTIKNIREGTKGFMEALKKRKYIFKVYYLKTYRCRKMLSFLIKSENRFKAIVEARKKMNILTDNKGILINVFKTYKKEG